MGTFNEWLVGGGLVGLLTIFMSYRRLQIDTRAGTFGEMQSIINNYKGQVQECQDVSTKQEAKIAKMITDHEAVVRGLVKERDDAIARAVAAEAREVTEKKRADGAEHELVLARQEVSDLRDEVSGLRQEVAELKEQIGDTPRSPDTRTRASDGGGI